MNSNFDIALTGTTEKDNKEARIKANAKFVADIFDSPGMKVSSKRNLKSDWVSWMSFIEDLNNIGMAAFAMLHSDDQLDTLIAYTQFLVSRGLKSVSIRRRLSGLSSILRLLGVDDGVTQNHRFVFYKKNLLETIGQPSRQAKPVQLDDLARATQLPASGNIKLLRATLVIQLGFDSLCRGSEIAALRQEDVKFKEDGSAVIFIRRSKSDQAAIGAYRAISATTGKLLKQWIELAQLAGRTKYVLCPVSSHSNKIRRLKPGKQETAIGYTSLLSDIKAIDPRFSVHSTRVGALQTLVKNKAQTYEIQLAGGWKSPAMITHYARELNVEDGAMRTLFNKLGR